MPDGVGEALQLGIFGFQFSNQSLAFDFGLLACRDIAHDTDHATGSTDDKPRFEITQTTAVQHLVLDRLHGAGV